MALSIRALAEGDFEAVNLILQASYGDSQNRLPRLHRYRRLQPDGWLIALLDDSPAGVVGAIDYGAFAYSGLLGVHPYAQRRGVGTALMQQLLAWLDRRRCPVVLLDAANPAVPLYRRLGFVVDEDVWLFQRTADRPLPPPSPRVRPLAPADIPAVVALDAPIFGAPRATVFEALLAETPGRALLACDAEGHPTGYLFIQNATLGPWIASARADAEELLAAGLRLLRQSELSVIVPAANQDARALLEQSGFRAVRALRHMRRGGPHPGVRALIYGQTSFVIG
jgi:GNAT superfamily N-acetyltransferase